MKSTHALIDSDQPSGCEMASQRPPRPIKVLLPFQQLCFYGLEKSVLELFEVLRPEVEASFILQRAAVRHQMPIWPQMQQRPFRFSFFHDWWNWPRMGRPRSLGYVVSLLAALAIGNLDVLRRSRRHDAIYICSWPTALYSFLASAALRLKGRKVICRFHDVPSKQYFWLRWALLMVTDFVHNTPQARDIAFDEQPWLKNRRNTVLAPVVLDRGPRTAPDLVAAAASRGRRILFVGQVSWHKGIDLLIESIGRLVNAVNAHPDVVLDVVGGCTGEYRAELEKLVGENRLAGHVIFWGFQEGVAEFYRRAYVYVQPTPPSRCMESFGRGAMEAAAFSVPAVCFRSGGLEYAVRDGVTGTICDSEDPEQLACVLRMYLDDPVLRARHAANAKEHYRSTCAPQAAVPDWLALFRGSLES